MLTPPPERAYIQLRHLGTYLGTYLTYVYVMRGDERNATNSPM